MTGRQIVREAVRRYVNQYAHMPSEADVRDQVLGTVPRREIRQHMREWHADHPSCPMHPDNYTSAPPKRYRLDKAQGTWTVRDYWSGEPRSVADFYEGRGQDAQAEAALYAAHLESRHAFKMAVNTARQAIATHLAEMPDWEVLELSDDLKQRGVTLGAVQ